LKLRASIVRIETARLALLTLGENKDERDNPHGQYEGSNDLDESNKARFHKIHRTIRIAAMEARRYITLRAECSGISAAFYEGQRVVHDEQDSDRVMKAVPPAQLASPAERSSATRPPPSAVRAVGGRLLIVDDEQTLLRGLTRLMGLVAPEWRISTALTAEQALTLLEAEAFDVMVTDLEMPGMGGLALLEQVVPQFPGMVVVVHSSHSNQRAEELADYCLSKPIGTDVLINTVSAAFAEALVRQNTRAARTSQTG